MAAKQTGDRAETVAATYLAARGYAILGRNWRHRRGEIDIIAEKDGIVHFVEVKYRRSNMFGRGFEYITPKKRLQMGFAADLWLVEHRWYGPYHLSALEVSGPEFKVSGFLASIS